MTGKIKVVIFARVSTNVQDYERQVNELTALANRNGWSVEAVFAEKVSGATLNEKNLVRWWSLSKATQ